MDPYAILGVPPTATLPECRRAYLRLSVSMHPDRNHHPRAHDQFCQLQRAWDMVKDPTARDAYDRQQQPIWHLDLRRTDLTTDLTYQCHCGGTFFLEEDDLLPCIIPCDGCSRAIRVRP